MGALVFHHEGNLLSIPGDGVRMTRSKLQHASASHGITRQEPLNFFVPQVFDPQFVFGSLAIGHQEVEAVSIGRKLWRDRISLRGNLVIAILVVEPHSAVLGADGRNERLAVRGHRNALLRGGTGGELLRLTARKTLPPEMKFVSSSGELHQLTVRRPSAGNT